MNVIYERCCGMDIHKNTIAACLITGRKKEIRSFSTMTLSLLGLIDWLKSAACQCVAMEATGSYGPCQILILGRVMWRVHPKPLPYAFLRESWFVYAVPTPLR